jgi:hypothetical protein
MDMSHKNLKVVDRSSFVQDGEQVERLALNVAGHDVQMLRFNWNDEALLVKVDQHVRQLPKKRVNGWILSRLLGR